MTRPKNTRIVALLIFAVLIGTVGLVGCDMGADADDPPTATDTGDAESDGAADGATEADDEATSGADDEATTGDEATETRAEGDVLIDELCTRCHSRIQIDAVTGRDRAGWDATIDRMIQIGANVTDAQRQAILDYLIDGS